MTDVLHRLPYRGHFNIRGIGTAYSFLPEDLPAGVSHPRELVDTEVGIGEVRMRVTAFEHWTIICPRDGERCTHPFALFVTSDPR